MPPESAIQIFCPHCMNQEEPIFQDVDKANPVKQYTDSPTATVMLGITSVGGGGGFQEAFAANQGTGSVGNDEAVAKASVLNVKISLSKIIKRRGSLRSAANGDDSQAIQSI
jgi:hypothetical protein